MSAGWTSPTPGRHACSRSRGAGSPDVHGLHDPATGSVQYVVADPATRAAIVVDPVLDFDPRAARVTAANADALVALVEHEGLTVVRVLDTHPHADHFSAAAHLAERFGAPTGIGERVRDIAALWTGLYGLADGAFDVDAAFDALFADGDAFALGKLECRVLLLPGHTLGSVGYAVGDAALVHDTFMQPDVGTSRCDFPGGSADALYTSLERVLALPDDVRLFVGHDYPDGRGREARWESTVAEQRRENAHLAGGTSRQDFVALREARDATLALPRLMLHALQVNLAGGRLPAPGPDGHAYLRIPVGRF